MTPMEINTTIEQPMIVAFFDDLMLTSRIESAARKVGFKVVFWGDPAFFGEEIRPTDGVHPGEPVEGRAGTLMDHITSLQPALLIFDISFSPIPWKEWVAVLKSSPATRRLPILCFGPHIDEIGLREAVGLGADEVLPRSRFLSRTADLIVQHASVHEDGLVKLACQDELSVDARAGLEAFNRGEYYRSHELLEDAWNEDDSAAKELYRAILQIAVAYLQIERGNYRGAVKMFLRSRQWLRPLPDMCRGVNVAQLRKDAALVYESLLDAGPDGVALIDSTLFAKITYD